LKGIAFNGSKALAKSWAEQYVILAIITFNALVIFPKPFSVLNTQ
jgi:hypothetical protein